MSTNTSEVVEVALHQEMNIAMVIVMVARNLGQTIDFACSLFEQKGS